MQSETATHRPPGGTTCPRTCISHTSGQVERAIGPTALQRAQDCILAEDEGLGCPVRFPRGAMSWRQGRLWGLTWTHLCLEQPFLAVAALKVIMFFNFWARVGIFFLPWATESCSHSCLERREPRFPGRCQSWHSYAPGLPVCPRASEASGWAAEGLCPSPVTWRSPHPAWPGWPRSGGAVPPQEG